MAGTPPGLLSCMATVPRLAAPEPVPLPAARHGRAWCRAQAQELQLSLPRAAAALRVAGAALLGAGQAPQQQQAAHMERLVTAHGCQRCPRDLRSLLPAGLVM